MHRTLRTFEHKNGSNPYTDWIRAVSNLMEHTVALLVENDIRNKVAVHEQMLFLRRVARAHLDAPPSVYLG